ncbi:DUF2190 family protein [Nesterenkonia lacusekhoensis]|uniref:DNA-binding beta-propeller fold protein YncE n=1 Tax=Nesterenkonia lacusekhoensis TaxID=150832 RepID=A0ABS4T521_9MICC|nr:DUF2190 family protein [Nesterenkonia lacusekhoensis]MBP2319570.1 DNA-binding beta-propeller fold protein YncE [Nesterenkonia lacusekhoensis]
MALNIRYPKALDSITLPVGAGVRSGDPVVVGNIAGLAVTDPHGVEYDRDGNVIEASIPGDPRATVKLIGSADFTVTGAASPGDVVYLGGSGLTMTAGDQPYGIALGEKGSGGGTLEVAPFGYLQPISGGDTGGAA